MIQTLCVSCGAALSLNPKDYVQHRLNCGKVKDWRNSLRMPTSRRQSSDYAATPSFHLAARFLEDAG